MIHIALFQPEIPPNTGNIIRLCANTGCQLHLIQPYAFELDNKKLRRAGLDYHEFTDIVEHKDFHSFTHSLQKDQRVFGFSTKGAGLHTTPNYQNNDVFLFGPETRGLPDNIINELPKDQLIRIPMLPDSRSLNLSNSVAVAIYEAWRQMDFTI